MNRSELNIQRACKILNVSRSGFYEYLHRRKSKRQTENEVLKEKINKIFHEHHGRYGTIRITKVLNQEGIHVNRKRVGRLLREMNLYAKGSRYKYSNYKRLT